MNKPLLSIGIIFKNDIRCLARCLESLTPLRAAIPCQLVMADTGSADGSRAVAEQYADILLDFPWVDDFAAARNVVLDRCTGEWCLTVDTDEWLDSDFGQLVDFLRGKKRGQYDMASIIQRNYQDKHLRAYGDFFAMRMGRRCGGELRYQGAIHEYLTYRNRETGGCIALQRVILHHDGYFEVDPGHIRKKLQRNMRRLRSELEKRPEDIRTLGQCIDSAENEREKREYTDRTRELLRRAKGPLSVGHVVAYQKCTQVYYDHQENELFLDCYQEWRQRCPGSALLRLDGEALAAGTCYRLKQYDDTLVHIKRYWEGRREVSQGKDLARKDRLYSQYNTDTPRWGSNLEMIRFFCLASLERYADMDDFLRDVNVEALEITDRGAIVLKVLDSAEKLPSAASFLSRCWAYLQNNSLWEAAGRVPEQKKATADFIHMLQDYLTHSREHGALFLAQIEGAPGLAARVLLKTHEEDILELMDQLPDWEWVYPSTYLHIMELRLPLPAALYRQPVEKMANLIAALAKQPAFCLTAADWLTHAAPPETPGELAWQFNLATAALRFDRWTQDATVGESLCMCYLALSSTYLDNVYHAELLNEEDILILPGVHRFAWYFQRAFSAMESGDELGYIRGLRLGLQAAPAMREMVDFLLEHKLKSAAQRELEELTEQVRCILAQCSPNDPAVAMLKQSEVYQKVFPLLFQQRMSASEPQTSESPVSPALLDEALAGTQEEIAASVWEHLARWGERSARSRVDYWETYPLWGSSKEAVVESLAAALSHHGADFRWLFDRLSDELSRRVLTAVVRGWRFFECAPLRGVRESRYDDYFDLDLFPRGRQEVLADLGAFTGDTFLSYVKNYGSLSYLRYYAYEITAESYQRLSQTTAPYPRVVLRRKGAGEGPGTMALHAGANKSANTLSKGETQSAETIETVALDDDIGEPLTFIKMDIEGAEQAALRGCSQHIRKERPKLALSVYHNFEDLWKLPRMIEELVPGYRFFLRYHGGDLWPTEITLLALPPKTE